MIVTVQTLGEFMTCVREAPSLFESTIRVSTIQRPTDGSGREAVRFDVILQVSAVVICEDGNQYLLQAGVECGRDYADASPEYDGSEEAERLRTGLDLFAKELNYKLSPGMIGV